VKYLLSIFAFSIVFQPAFPVVEYFLNYNYISKELCENKDKPELECNGKCYLMKSLAEAAQKESNNKKEHSVKKVDIPLLYIQEIKSMDFCDQEPVNAITFSKITETYTFIKGSNIFHPPCS